MKLDYILAVVGINFTLFALLIALLSIREELKLMRGDVKELTQAIREVNQIATGKPVEKGD